MVIRLQENTVCWLIFMFLLLFTSVGLFSSFFFGFGVCGRVPIVPLNACSVWMRQ